jgi:hypothetical protein
MKADIKMGKRVREIYCTISHQHHIVYHSINAIQYFRIMNRDRADGLISNKKYLNAIQLPFISPQHTKFYPKRLFPTATLEILRRHYKIHAVIAV